MYTSHIGDLAELHRAATCVSHILLFVIIKYVSIIIDLFRPALTIQAQLSVVASSVGSARCLNAY